jgi:hypothetical protein
LVSLPIHGKQIVRSTGGVATDDVEEGGRGGRHVVREAAELHCWADKKLSENTGENTSTVDLQPSVAMYAGECSECRWIHR